VSSLRAELGGMASSALRTSSCVTMWQPWRLSEGWCCGGGPLSGKKACPSASALSSKLVAALIVAGDPGALGSAFLTVCHREDELVFSTTMFQCSCDACRIARR